jgi:hypothetical protein
MRRWRFEIETFAIVLGVAQTYQGRRLNGLNSLNRAGTGRLHQLGERYLFIEIRRKDGALLLFTFSSKHLEDPHDNSIAVL